MKKINKKFYLTSIYGWFVPILLLNLLIVLGTKNILNKPEEGYFILGLFSFMFVIYSLIMVMKLLYKMWTALQDGNPRIKTPRIAVTYHFAPILNIFWIFKAWNGWVKDYNQYILDKNIENAPPVSVKLSFILCWFSLFFPYIMMVPILNIIVIILYFKFHISVIDGINAIIDSQE